VRPFVQEGQYPLTGQRAPNFRLLVNQWAQRRLVTQWRHGCRAMWPSVCNAGASNAGRSLCIQISRERSYPCQYIDTIRKAIDCAKTLPLTIFIKQEGQHPLTGQRAANFRQDLEATYDFNWWLLGKPVTDCMFAVITRRPASADRTARADNFRRDLRRRRTLIDGYLESPFPTACLL